MMTVVEELQLGYKWLIWKSWKTKRRIRKVKRNKQKS